MEQAIKKAIEGGYVISKYNLGGRNIDIRLYEWRKYPILLDPLFWQALGKAEGWGYEKGKFQKYQKGILQTIDENEGKKTFTYEGWLKQMHLFIDHIAEGKDIDSFFNELLK